MGLWAQKSGVEPTQFAERFISFYEPDLHRLLRGQEQPTDKKRAQQTDQQGGAGKPQNTPMEPEKQDGIGGP